MALVNNFTNNRFTVLAVMNRRFLNVDRSRIMNKNIYTIIKRYYPKQINSEVLRGIYINRHLLAPTYTYSLMRVPRTITFLLPRSTLGSRLINKTIFCTDTMKSSITEKAMSLLEHSKNKLNINAEILFQDSLNNEQIPSLDVIKRVLEIYNNKREINNEDELLLKKLNIFINKNTEKPENYPLPITRDQEEYKRFCLSKTNVSDLCTEDLKQFFKLEKLSRCFTLENMNYEIERNKKGLDILNKYSDKLTEAEIIEILRRINFINNPDAIFFNGIGMITIKEGEGPKLQNLVYNVISDNLLFKKDSGEYPNVYEILKTIKKADSIKVGLTNRDIDLSTLLLSGNDLHMLLVINDPNYKDHYLILGMLTSTKDKDTIMLTKNQQSFYEHTGNSDKSQMIRFSKSLIRINKSDFKEIPSATAFINTFKENNEPILNKINLEIEKNSEEFKKHCIEDLRNFTKDTLLTISKAYLKSHIEKLELNFKHLQDELDKLSPEQRVKVIEKAKNQEKNIINEQRKVTYISSLPEELRLIIKIQDRLTRLREIKKSIEKKRKDEELYAKYRTEDDRKQIKGNSNKDE